MQTSPNLTIIQAGKTLANLNHFDKRRYELLSVEERAEVKTAIRKLTALSDALADLMADIDSETEAANELVDDIMQRLGIDFPAQVAR